MRLITILFTFITIWLSSGLDAQQSSKSDTIIIKEFLNKAENFLNAYPDSSILLTNKALALATKNDQKQLISKALQLKGKYYVEKEKFSDATDCYLKALSIEEKRKDERRIASLYNGLGYIYLSFDNFNKGLDYHNKAFALFKKNNDTLGLSKTLHCYGTLFGGREYCENRTASERISDFKIAIDYFQKSVDLSEKIKDEYGIHKGYIGLGNTYRKINLFDKSLHFNQLALEYFRKDSNWDDLANTLRSIAKTYAALKQYKNAINCHNECLQIKKTRNLTEDILYIYEDISDTYSRAGQYKKARDYFIKYMILRDSLFNLDKSQQIFEIETRYQTEKKEKEILNLVIERKKKNSYIILLISLIILGSTTAVYFILQHRNKRIIAEQTSKINEQKVKEFEKERQLLATQSVLKGEEAERTRLARDLHDGLGGLLSGVKLTLTNLKGNYIISPENMDKYDHAVNLLDNSIKELRRVAHNMMPEALVKFGLKDALQDFCEQISAGKTIELSFHFFGESNRLDQPLETTIYRIAQELINNVLKHAKASEIIVQVMQESNRIHLTVQDNGQGFDISQVNAMKSAGIQNIKARVESFNGRMDIDSVPGKGTEICVEFNC